MITSDRGPAAQALIDKAVQLEAERDEALVLLREVVDGEEGDYPITAIRALLARLEAK